VQDVDSLLRDAQGDRVLPPTPSILRRVQDRETFGKLFGNNLVHATIRLALLKFYTRNTTRFVRGTDQTVVAPPGVTDHTVATDLALSEDSADG